jgi:histone acetyltransferase 1
VVRRSGVNCVENDDFVIYRCSPSQQGPEMKKFHERCQRITFWFINGASTIDLDDERWEILYVFKLSKDTQDEKVTRRLGNVESLVGFVTLYNFRNPIKGTRLRVCQALVLPPFQRQGHGQQLLRCVYDKLALPRPFVTEVTVEDPASGFTKLRDATDFQLCEDLQVFGGLGGDTAAVGGGSVVAPSSFALEKNEIIRIQKATKITEIQIVLCFEATCLRMLLNSVEGSNDDSLKLFRLAVKRRLRAQHFDEITALERKEDRLTFLAEAYEAHERRLKEIARMASAMQKALDS